MPLISRYICVRYNDVVFEVNNTCKSDAKAKIQAVHEVERRLGLMRGALLKHFANNPDEIWFKLL